MLPSFCTETVIRVRPQIVDKRGSEVFDWENAEKAEISGCSVQPTGSTLDQAGRFATSLSATLYAPIDADILTGDRIEFDGDTYLINGRPKKWRSPSGAASHLVCDLTDWEG